MNKVIICNHKMFLTHDESLLLREQMDTLNYSNIDLIICPNHLNFNVFGNYKLSSQDCFYEDKGPYTGEVSAYNLSLIGIRYSLVGHSERRKVDTDEIINLKIKAILRNSMIPILCIGETKSDRALRKTSIVLKKQLEIALKDIKPNDLEEILVAYEPRWLLGKNLCLQVKEIEDSLMYVQKILDSLEITKYKLLYGGSINSNNFHDILSKKIDGYLLGNSSVCFDEFNKIIKCIK